MSNQINLEPNQTYSLSLTGNDIINLQAAIMELPAKFANPLMAKITEQLTPKELEVLTPDPE